MTTKKWIEENCKDLTGKTVVITGSTSGLGLNAVKILAQKNANLILINRNEEKSEKLKNKLLQINNKIKIDILLTDLSIIENVKETIEKLKKFKIDYLILNAGVYAAPLYKTDSGFNNIFTTNFVSHFLIAKSLIENLDENHAKIVAVGSISYDFSKIDENDVDFSKQKNPNKIYGNSKKFLMYSLLNLVKNYENVSLSLAHPGISHTKITSNYSKFMRAMIYIPMELHFTPAKRACLNTIFALNNNVGNHEWIGPRIKNIWGKPKVQPLKIDEIEFEKIGKISIKIADKL